MTRSLRLDDSVYPTSRAPEAATPSREELYFYKRNRELTEELRAKLAEEREATAGEVSATINK